MASYGLTPSPIALPILLSLNMRCYSPFVFGLVVVCCMDLLNVIKYDTGAVFSPMVYLEYLGLDIPV